MKRAINVYTPKAGDTIRMIDGIPCVIPCGILKHWWTRLVNRLRYGI